MLGCGEIAYKATGEAVKASSNAEMVIAMDPVEHVARSFADTYGAEATTEAAHVLERADVDAVVISAPHYLHAPLAIQAARYGKHVIVEKPIACTLGQADGMIAACRDAGVRLAVFLPSRYATATAKARELVQEGAIGDVLALKFHAASNKPLTYWTGGYTQRVTTDWRMSKEKSGGGILIMNLVHDIDRMRYITGREAVRVFAEYDTFATDTEVEDFITVSIRYDNGALGNVLASSCARGGDSTGNRIYGSDGQIIFGRGLRVYTDREVAGLKKGAWTELDVSGEDNRRVFIERFAEAVFEGKAPDVPGEEGRKTLEVIRAAYRSGETHQPICLPLEDDR
jgi:predicted dehydrogenase